MTQEIFWEIIESSWADSPNLYKKRANVLKNNDEEIIRELCIELENTILEY
ncbi:hypothetical protein J2Y60_001792 [Arcicella sp. BE140]|uniref:hypothetical protein n=1 Tax=unclassified Arcicella TaxID=2644986 RepID=UPI002865D9AD|nr:MULTISPECIES: hypothetical protein [unclassified Arcicella]MDR6563255.1 hypothetical protein [Arcicella sp. BE51]MDR6811594.1 hypothetical protein [Arcicella sp. BE140]MDR6823120.1 hypothetical protein [Arcicella sp. BE139]